MLWYALKTRRGRLNQGIHNTRVKHTVYKFVVRVLTVCILLEPSPCRLNVPTYFKLERVAHSPRDVVLGRRKPVQLSDELRRRQEEGKRQPEAPQNELALF